MSAQKFRCLMYLQPQSYCLETSDACNNSTLPQTATPNMGEPPRAPPYPLSVVIATEKGTRLLVAPRSTHMDYNKAPRMEEIALPPQHAVLFHGHVQHCGCSYPKQNHRLHCYVLVPGGTAPDNSTAFAQEV